MARLGLPFAVLAGLTPLAALLVWRWQRELDRLARVRQQLLVSRRDCGRLARHVARTRVHRETAVAGGATPLGGAAPGGAESLRP